MHQNDNIQQLIEAAIQHLSEKSYSATTIYHHNWVWRKLITFAEERGEKAYSLQLSKEFIDYFVLSRKRNSDHFDKFTVSLLRALKVLDDFFHGRPEKKKYLSIPVHIPECFQEEYSSYKECMVAKGQRPMTISTKLSRILVFLRFMEENRMTLCDLSFSVLTIFQEYLRKKYNTVAQSNINFTIRDFLRFAEAKNLVPDKASSTMIGTIYNNKHGRLPSTYTSEEINRILLSIDRATISGKRDYAMLALMATLGMRCSDICNLRLDAVHPESHSLVFKQQKTGSYESLPLTEAIEMALADYLKNARPESESECLFIKCKGVHKNTTYSSGGLYPILNRYMKKAGIETKGKRHGPHSIRHSLSSNLLKDGTPIPVIAGILGHSSSEVTTRYLWMDLEQLRQLALEVPYEA